MEKFWSELDALGATDFLTEGVPDGLPLEPDPAVSFDDDPTSIMDHLTHNRSSQAL